MCRSNRLVLHLHIVREYNLLLHWLLSKRAACLVLLSVSAVLAADFPVTWNLGTNYGSYTNRAFNVNDTLTFTYDNTHTVDVVTKTNYENCNSASPISTDSSGKTTITLGEGTTYIICGTPGHCNGGMKLQVTTSKASTPSGSTPPPTTSPTTPPTTPSTTTPAGSGTEPVSSPPPNNDNGVMTLSTSHFVFGLPLVLGTLFAFMG